MGPELVDSHCHLDLIALDADSGGVEAVLSEARAAGVGHALCIGVTLERCPDVLALAEAHDTVFASVGVHPNERVPAEPDTATLTGLARHPRVVAVGETGLDYYRSEGDLGWQLERFRRHIRAAREAGLPLVVHSRSAAEDTLRVLREEGAAEVGGVMHCFAEGWDIAREVMDLGLYISLSGIVTFPRAHGLHDVARRLPLERLLVETDAPWLAPVPHRGRPNRPAYVRHTAEHIARLRGEPLERVAWATTDNFFRLFARAGRATGRDPSGEA
jgi:TatD DNase family protein